MNEALLQYIWQTRQYNEKALATSSGERLFIIHPGYLNSDAGPDFLHAKVRISDTLWAGHVELHVHSHEWEDHGHSRDDAYRNVILHVVFIHDREIRVPGRDEALPTLELKPRISTSLLNLYQQFYRFNTPFACQNQFSSVGDPVVSLTKQRMAVERLEDKSNRIKSLWESLSRDWLHTLLCLVGKTMAGPVNADSMEQLLTRLDPKWLLRVKDDPLQLEAMLLGAAGLIVEPCDEYSGKLAKEFAFLQRKHPIVPMDKVVWKYSRMRPDNFIDLRIAQFAFWLHSQDSIWQKLLSCLSVKDLRSVFRVRIRHYWATHYRIGKVSDRKPKQLGSKSVDLIIVNALSPLIFLFGRTQGKELYQEKAMQWLMELAPEENRITRMWGTLGVKAENGFEGQGLIHWRKNYCDRKACAKCPVAHAILQAGSKEDAGQ